MKVALFFLHQFPAIPVLITKMGTGCAVSVIHEFFSSRIPFNGAAQVNSNIPQCTHGATSVADLNRNNRIDAVF